MMAFVNIYHILFELSVSVNCRNMQTLQYRYLIW